MNRRITLKQLQSFAYRNSPKAKLRVLKSFQGSLEFHRYLDPSKYETAVKQVMGEHPNRMFGLTPRQRKQIKAILNSPYSSTSQPASKES